MPVFFVIAGMRTKRCFVVIAAAVLANIIDVVIIIIMIIDCKVSEYQHLITIVAHETRIPSL